jgi:predicted GNAT superfamily acetyltransferase
MASHPEGATLAGTAGFNATAQAERIAATAARRAGVTLTTPRAMDDLRRISGLLESVWGRTAEGVPLNSELLRSLVHAGGAVTAAHDAGGELVGAAVLSPAAPAGSSYSLIAAASSGHRDRGVGRAVKLAQRAWALQHGFRSMVWTFDPLVSRNARFNLARLGAVADAYEPSFYGRMSDAINGTDDSDRLVARWELGSQRVVAATEGTAPDPAPDAAADVLGSGPDGWPMLRQDASGLWCRVPADIVDVRRRAPEDAARWRTAVRAAVTKALADGRTATHMTRDGWYLLTSEEGPR